MKGFIKNALPVVGLFFLSTAVCFAQTEAQVDGVIPVRELVKTTSEKMVEADALVPSAVQSRGDVTGVREITSETKVAQTVESSVSSEMPKLAPSPVDSQGRIHEERKPNATTPKKTN